jgi:type IV pilus assembly protein PilP
MMNSQLGRCAGSVIIIAMLLSSLSGCNDGGMQDVKQWMAEVKSQAKVVVPKLPPPKKFTPFTYSEKDVIDPFNPVKLTVAFAKLQSNASSALKPDMTRRREPLEDYPLDSVVLVGTLNKTGVTYAILQVDKTIFEAKTGNYIGQNFGMITNVTDTEVNITERVQDASDAWVERKTTLELQESKK